MGGGGGTKRERKKKEKLEENEKFDKKEPSVGVGFGPCTFRCASGGVTTRPRGHSRYRACW